MLKYPDVRRVVLVDLDAEMTEVFRRSAELTRLNGNSLAHPKLQIVNADAAQWLENATDSFDVAIIDLPDPSNFALGKLYSVPMYRMLARRLNPGARVVVQSTSPYFAPNAYWSVVATLEAAGFATAPYHAYVPSFGEWGFVLAAREGSLKAPERFDVPTRYLTSAEAAAMFRFPPDMARRPVKANYLNNQALVAYFAEDWARFSR